MTAASGPAAHVLPQFDAPIGRPFGPSPVRRPGSVRRTTTIDVVWPEGKGGLAELFGAGRDLLTPADGSAPATLAERRIHAVADLRTLRSVTTEPPLPALDRLAGVRAGGHLRAAIDDALPAERLAGTILYLLLDDLAGATLVAGWSFSRWPEEHAAEPQRAPKSMESVCIGFRPGSSALQPDGAPRRDQNASSVLPLVNPDDPAGWHALLDRGGINFRRARRIDVWRDAEGVLRIEAGFQDSASAPGGGRIAIHEYRIAATADAAGRLTTLIATPGTLPFAECRAAPSVAETLIGAPLRDLRSEVLTRLRATAGCTHLNDMLRALAEVPVLDRALGTSGVPA